MPDALVLKAYIIVKALHPSKELSSVQLEHLLMFNSLSPSYWTLQK